MGSAITYARRYSLSAILGVVADEDDDGNGAQGRNSRAQAEKDRGQAKANNHSPMSKAQSDALMAYLTLKHGDNREAYLEELSEFFGRKIGSSRELTKADVSDFLDAISRGREAA